MRRGGALLLGVLVFQCQMAATPAPAEQRFQPLPANGLAPTPPMGWNSWNRYGCNIDAALIRRQAEAMVASGMKTAGYRYVIIDDCWQASRDGAGNIVPDPVRFPAGIQPIAAYVHSLGLEFGIYSDVGNHTCQRKPGSRGHEYQDALRYASWGVDYLKYDWCDSGALEPREAYETMSAALRASGRPIVFSICEWGTNQPWLWGAAAGGNLWRTTEDISDVWQRRDPNVKSLGVLDILDAQVGLGDYAGPGHWNDPDMLEVGNGGMSDDQYRAHFSLWAILAAPLIAGNDLTAMSAATRAILTNAEVIAVDQDPLGIEGHRALKDGDSEIWVRPLQGGTQAVVLLNRAATARTIRLDWSALGLPPYLSLELRDLWRHQDLPRATAGVELALPATAALMLRVRPARP